jgi:2-polyprenyl-3-methyl-5-hydroxy-6-metoxy-1,4-benzoquinol methylase
VEANVDTIVCMQVLCSVPSPSGAAKQMHRLLNPGGQLLFWEHQVSRDALMIWVRNKLI